MRGRTGAEEPLKADRQTGIGRVEETLKVRIREKHEDEQKKQREEKRTCLLRRAEVTV